MIFEVTQPWELNNFCGKVGFTLSETSLGIEYILNWFHFWFHYEEVKLSKYFNLGFALYRLTLKVEISNLNVLSFSFWQSESLPLVLRIPYISSK